MPLTLEAAIVGLTLIVVVVKAKWVYASSVETVEKKGGHGGTPTRTVVFAIWGLEEPEGDEGWGPYEVQS